MTTTPTIWKAKYNPNFGGLAGVQTAPQSIGLANGNILTVWEDDTFGPGVDRDIVGRIFTPLGGPLGPQFQVNSAVTAGPETGPKIAAMPDGGYVIAWGGFLEVLGGFIGVERFDRNGGSVASRFITDPRSSLTQWEIAVDTAGNYTVAFERFIDDVAHTGADVLSVNIHAITYNGVTNAAGPERIDVAQNERDEDDRLAAIAALPSGHIVTLITEPDYSFDGLPSDTTEFTVFDPANGALTRAPQEIAGVTGGLLRLPINASAVDVAVRTGGQIVMLYDKFGFGSEPSGLFIRIAASEAHGSVVGPPIKVADRRFSGEAQVVALPDGGFFITWLNVGPTGLFGTRYDVFGNEVGEAGFLIATGVSTALGSLGSLSLTSDGRILVPFRDSAGEISQVILDPRDNIIHGTTAGDALTTQLGSTALFGEAGDDTLYGLGGNDTFDGGLGQDILKGEAGDDTYILRDGKFLIFLNPLSVAWYYADTVVEEAAGGSDTVRVSAARNDANEVVLSSYGLGPNIEHGVVAGPEAFALTGNELANSLTGNNAADTLEGGLGNDTLNGGFGADALAGGPGDDLYILAAVHASGTAFVFDTVNEGVNAGTDGIYVQRLQSAARYTLPANVENGFVATVDAFTLTGNALPNLLTGNAGADSLAGLLGDDYILGNAGADTVQGGAGADTIGGGGGRDSLFGPDLAANGSFIAGSGNDALLGGDDDDGLWGGDGDDALQGQAGSDGAVGGAGNDLLDGGEGDDFLFGGDFAAVTGQRLPGSGADRLRGGDGKDGLYGFDGDDRIEGDAGNDYAEAGDGADDVRGGAGDDTLLAQAGNDILTGGAGFDYLYGGAGADTVSFRKLDSYDTIWDFAKAEGDRLRLDPALGVTSFAQFQSRLTGFNFDAGDGRGLVPYTVLNFAPLGSNDQIQLGGIAHTAWTAAMVEFV